MYKRTVGTDVEEFLSVDGSIIPACGIIPGTKQDQHPLPNGMCQVDNMSVEWGTKPVSTLEQFIKVINKVRGEALATAGLRYEYKLAPLASYEFSMDAIQANIKWGSLVFGCDPDFNAWLDGEENEKPNPYTQLRTNGGHIHVSLSEDQSKDILTYVRRLDASLGLMSVIKDPDSRRRELYGKAGAYRPKPYGLEYRVLSNFWIKSDALITEVWDGIDWALSSTDEPDPVIEEIINNGNVDLAKQLYWG